MANPSDKQMLRDANGDLIPQFWDITAGDFKPLTGSDGAQDTRLTGSIVEKILLDKVTITAGSRAHFEVNMTRIRRFSLGVISNIGNSKWTVEMKPKTIGNEFLYELNSNPEEWNWSFNNNRSVSKIYDNFAPIMRFILKNQGTSDIEYTLYLFDIS